MMMEAILNLITRGSLVLVAALTLVDFLRQRDRTRLDIALMFGTLASIILIESAGDLSRQEIPWINSLGALLLLAQPYLLLRLVQHFREVPRAIEWSALGGMMASWAMLVLFPPLPGAAALTMVAYFVGVESYAAAAFLLGALTRRGVTRWRLGLAAAGSGLLAATILLAGVRIVLPLGDSLITPLSRLLAALAGLSYYLSFVPPRWLRRTWQMPELYHFLQDISGRAANPPTPALKQLCEAAIKVVGGMATLAALPDEMGERLVVNASANFAASPERLTLVEGAARRAWRDSQPALGRSAAEFGLDGASQVVPGGAGALLAAPIRTQERAIGLLLVFLRRAPLFAADDLDLLALLAGQTALVLDHTALVEQLRQHSQQLEAANQELEAFSYSVSHDLRAPLRAVDGFSRILLEKHAPQLDPEAQRYLGLVRDNARQMGQLIDDLLAFSRLSRQALKRQPVAPAELVRQTLENLRDEQAGRQVEINIGNLPTCAADPALLRQVFANLLANALKFTRERDAARIEVGCQPQDGQRIYFVRDNGVGFDMRYAHKLFGVFQRLHRPEEYEGTGVGLAIVQRIIHRHGGQVWAESEPGSGAAFYFTLGEENDG